MRVDREIQLVRQADLPCDVTVEDEAVYLRIEATGRPVVVEISFPAAYPFMAPSVRVVDGKEVLGGKFVEGDPSLELASLQGWTPSTQAVELAREVIDAVVRLADAAAGREEGHHKTKTRRVAPAPEPEDEHAAPAPSRAAIAEPYYRPGEGVPFAALEQLMTFCAVHRVYTATEREELRCGPALTAGGEERVGVAAAGPLEAGAVPPLQRRLTPLLTPPPRYIGLSAESLTEVNPHPSKLNHVIVQFQVRGSGSAVRSCPPVVSLPAPCSAPCAPSSACLFASTAVRWSYSSGASVRGCGPLDACCPWSHQTHCIDPGHAMRAEVVRSPGPAAQDAGHGHEDGVEEGLAADERHSGTRAAAGEGAATDPGTDAGTAARAGAGTGAGVGSAGPPEHRRVVLAAEVVTYSSPEARSVAGQIVQRMKGLGLQPAKKGGGEQQLDSAQPTAEELVRQRDGTPHPAQEGRVAAWCGPHDPTRFLVCAQRPWRRWAECRA